MTEFLTLTKILFLYVLLFLIFQFINLNLMASFLKEDNSFFGNEQEITAYEQNDPSLSSLI